MKLIKILISLLNENRRAQQYLYGININDHRYSLISSAHQWFERHGDLNYEEIKDLYYEKSEREPKYRIGVPNTIIIDIFKQNINKIIDSFNNLNENKIIFVKNNTTNDEEENFDYIEFLLAIDKLYTFIIVTSALSSDGNYLRNINPTPRLRVENKDPKQIKIVFL